VRSRLKASAVFVALLALAAHASSLFHGFVYDDHRFVRVNPAIRSLANAPSFFTDASTASAAAGIEPDIYRPIRTLDFALDHAMFGLHAFGWHLASVLLHVANSVLVWLLLVRVLVPPRFAAGGRLQAASSGPETAPLVAATAGAALFAVHPVGVESVAWVSSRGDLLATLLLLLALEVVVRRGVGRTVAGAALVLLACLAKESAVVACLLLPLRDRALPEGVRPPARTTWARAAVFAAVAGLYMGLRWMVLRSLAQTDFPDGSRAAAGRGMLSGVVWYARVLLWPAGFPFDRNVFTDPVPVSWLDPEVVLGAGVLATMLLGGALAWFRGRGATAMALLWPIAALLPVSNVIVPLKAFTAERFLYPALPGVACGAAVLGLFLARRLPRPSRQVLVAVAAALCVALGVVTTARAAPWKDDASLWTAVREEDPLNPRAYEGLGFEYLSQGKLDPAERAFSTYREFQPLDGKVHAELADVLMRVHDVLVPIRQEEGTTTDVEQKRRFALRESLKERRAAAQAWERVGLARGRGSVALERRNLEKWREGAVLFGDFLEAKRVNDRLMALDVAAQGAPAGAQKTARLLLASLALTDAPRPTRSDDPDDPTVRPVPKAVLDRWNPVRNALLADVGIDPTLSDRDAATALLPLFAPAIAEKPKDLQRRRERIAIATIAGSERAPDDGARCSILRTALEDLAVIAAADPGDVYVRQRLESIDGVYRRDCR
jgi:hypothetical protein